MTRVLLKDLTPGTDYAIQVRAVGPDSVSEYSPKFLIQTISDVDSPDVPEWADVSAFVADDTSFAATWKPIDSNLENNRDLAFYEVEFDSGGATFIANTSATHYVLTFEENVSRFGTPQPALTARVRSVDTSGNASAWSTPINASNPVPGAPVNIAVSAAADQIAVSWDAPSDNDIKHYRAHVGSTAGFTPDSSNKVFIGDSLSFTYTTTTYSAHYFKVFAVDVFNQDSAPVTSDAVTPDSPFTTDSTPPDVPSITDVALTNNDDGNGSSADITWDLTNPPTDLAGFYVRFRRVGTANYNVVSFTHEDRAGHVELAHAYTDYDFQIKAFDWQNNESAWSSTFNAVAPANTAPGAPTGLSVTPEHYSIDIAWTAPVDEDIDTYEVEVDTENTFTTPLTYFTGNATTLFVGGLSSETEYFVRVRTIDTGGLSSGWSVTVSDSTGAGREISADLLRAATLTSDTGIIDIGAGAVLRLNGGNIRSNTYTNTVYDESASAGFYLGNDGMVIVDGAVFAETFRGGTFDAGDINIAAGGSITGGSWSLDETGLSIPDGAISASKLLLQAGNNIVPPLYADFEGHPSVYTDHTFLQSEATLTVIAGKFNDQAVEVTWTGLTGNAVLYLGTADNDYNVVFEEGQEYILSAYVWNSTAVDSDMRLRIRWDDGTWADADIQTITAATDVNNAVRMQGVLTAPAGVRSGIVNIASTTQTDNAGFSIDGVQLELKESAQTQASPWKPSSSTTVTGGQIVTGEIRSTNTIEINGFTEPVWSIPLNGSATFSGMRVLGNTVLGNEDDDTDSSMSSYDYIPGERGWTVSGDGFAEFRNMAADSIDGSAIVAETLSVEKLSGGDFGNQINLIEGSELVAGGLMGELVSFGDFGFTVNGPQDQPVVNKEIASGVATLTTESDHGMEPGQKINVLIEDEDFDGVYNIDTVPSTTTFTYLTSSADVASTPVGNGSKVQGSSPLAGEGPLYISFPTDGTEPNIISGELSANNVSVANTITMFNEAYLEQGSTLLMNAVTERPKKEPAVQVGWSGVKFNGIPHDDIRGYAIGHDRKHYVASGGGHAGAWAITRHADNGTKHNTVLSYFGGFGGGTDELNSFTYTESYGGRYYVHHTFQGDRSSTKIEYIDVYDTSWNFINDFILAQSGDGSDPIDSAFVGWDFIDDRLMVIHKASNEVRFRPYNMSAAGVPINPAASAVAPFSTGHTPIFVARGMFDNGVDRTIVAVKQQGSGSIGSEFLAFTSTGTNDGNYSWPKAGGKEVGGAYWDVTTERFYSFTNGNTKYTYESGDSIWLGSDYDTRWVGYSWYNSTVDLETDLSPRKELLLARRARMVVTIDPVPYSELGTNVPDQAKVYIKDGDTDGYSTDPTQYKFRKVINHGTTSATITSGFVGTSTPNPEGTNDFASVSSDPAIIISSSGNSFWDANGEAKFQRLIVESSEDVTANAGNRPALRIGNITGNHLRMDGNEIQSMSGDSATGSIILQRDGSPVLIGNPTNQLYLDGNDIRSSAGGSPTLLRINDTGGNIAVAHPSAQIELRGKTKLGTSGRQITALQFGTSTATSNSNGRVVVSHGLGTTPISVAIANHAVGNPKVPSIVTNNSNGTSFTVEFVDSRDGTLLTNAGGCNFDWIAIA